MQCCQHCGSKSWAPPDSQSSNHYVTDDGFDVGERAENILICDGCGEWGLKSVIDDMVVDPIYPNPGHPPSPLDSMAAQLQMFLPLFQSFLPKPETRLERLVKALIAGKIFQGGSGDYVQSTVKLARALETEIDREELAAAPRQSSTPDADFTDGPDTDIGTHR